jgi:hypothetical protein
MHTHSNGDAYLRSPPQAAFRRYLRLWPLTLLLLAPTASQTQARKSCPRYARVPGYGACTNLGGSCGFCAYRCNDDTVVRWNVCGK